MASLPINKPDTVNAAPIDNAGSPTGESFSGPLTFSIDQPTIASITPAADGLSALLTPITLGTVVVSATGSVHSNPNPISGTLSVQITDVATAIKLTLA